MMLTFPTIITVYNLNDPLKEPNTVEVLAFIPEGLVFGGVQVRDSKDLIIELHWPDIIFNKDLIFPEEERRVKYHPRILAFDAEIDKSEQVSKLIIPLPLACYPIFPNQEIKKIAIKNSTSFLINLKLSTFNSTFKKMI